MTRERLGVWAESESIDRGSSWRVTWIAVNRLWRTATAARRRGDRWTGLASARHVRPVHPPRARSGARRRVPGGCLDGGRTATARLAGLRRAPALAAARGARGARGLPPPARGPAARARRRTSRWRSPSAAPRSPRRGCGGRSASSRRWAGCRGRCRRSPRPARSRSGSGWRSASCSGSPTRAGSSATRRRGGCATTTTSGCAARRAAAADRGAQAAPEGDPALDPARDPRPHPGPRRRARLRARALGAHARRAARRPGDASSRLDLEDFFASVTAAPRVRRPSARRATRRRSPTR